MRWLLATLFYCALSVAAHANCSTATPPTNASFYGLTNLLLCDEFGDSNSIDANNTKDPTTCANATFPSKQCHWYVNNAWSESTLSNCNGTGSTSFGGKCVTNFPPTQSGDWSTGVSGLQMTPQVAVTNATSHSNTTVNINSLTSGSFPSNSAVIGVYGPGVPASTTATLSGCPGVSCTATLSAATTTSTTGTFYFEAIYNGWMFQTAVADATAPGGYRGLTFQPPFFIEITNSVGTSGTNWSSLQSSPSLWLWPAEMLTVTHNGTPTYPYDFCEFDFFEAQFNAGTIHGESINGDGKLYWSGDQLAGHTNYSAQSTTASSAGTHGINFSNASNSTISAGVGFFKYSKNNVDQFYTTYGPGTTPAITGSGSFINAGTPASGYWSNVCDNRHYILQIDASPEWTHTVTMVHVWGLPIGASFPTAKR